MSQILEQVVDAIFRIDYGLNIKFVSNNGLRWLGGKVPSVPASFIDLISQHDIEIFKDAHLGIPDFFSCEVRLIKNGEEVWTNIKGTLMRSVKEYVLCVFDISKWRNLDNNLLYAVEHDSLTKLPNRVLLEKTVNKLIFDGELFFSLALLDLDGFKKVNDTFGHLAGDLVLVETAKRLMTSIDESEGDIAVRLGGDEFVVLLRDSKDFNKHHTILTRVLQNISRPYELGTSDAYLGASIGLANYPDHGETYTDLLKNADTAMYISKNNGKNRISVYMECVDDIDFSINSALHRGIRDGEFYLEYQPQYTSDGVLVGAEALMRWNSSIFGIIPPGKFIPIAESSGLMAFLGKWALRYACHHLKLFQAIMPEFTLSVNVSPVQFKDDTFDATVLDVLEETNIESSKLMLEITESTLMQHRERLEYIFDVLKDNEIRFAIDDFGTGFSSLSYLTRLPISKIKIDKTFISALDYDKNQKLVSAMINLTHSIGLKCIAEGVETNEQLSFLKNNGCDVIQGFLLGKPMSSDDLMDLLHSVSEERIHEI